MNYAEQKAAFDKMTIGMFLSIAYSANVGGVATLTGTTPNLVLKGSVDEYEPTLGRISAQLKSLCVCVLQDLGRSRNDFSH
jgi:di/tricarboxylate transporter